MKGYAIVAIVVLVLLGGIVAIFKGVSDTSKSVRTKNRTAISEQFFLRRELGLQRSAPL